MAFPMEKGCCNTTLRKSCIIIAALGIVSALILTLRIESSNVLGILELLFLFIANVSLLFGAIKNNQTLVLIWLIIQIFIFIYWPFDLLGTVFGFGGFVKPKEYNAIAFIIARVIGLAINIYFTLIVYSFHKDLKSAKTTTTTEVA